MKILSLCICFLFLWTLSSLSFPEVSYASLGKAYQSLKRGNKPLVAENLAQRGLFFTAVPFIKSTLLRGGRQRGRRGVHRRLDRAIERIGIQVGVKQFEVLPARILKNSKAPLVRFILAKKSFRQKQYKQALAQLKRIPFKHSIKPFAFMLEGSIYSIIKRYDRAIDAYEQCISTSDSRLSGLRRSVRKRQLIINRDTCVVGIPRAEFAAGRFDQAHLSYLDLPKQSFIWPEILFEEAWTSFYQRDYNRTLGKLVTYKAPIFQHIFNPEIEILRALTFLELCLWTDAQNKVDEFYKMYQVGAQKITRHLERHGKDYRYYYRLAKEFHKKKKKSKARERREKLLRRLLSDITRDGTYREMMDAFQRGQWESRILETVRDRAFRKILKQNLRSALQLQRNLIGAYVRKRLLIYKNQIVKTFKDMSYIKLEVLARKKDQIYSPSLSSSKGKRSRGDVKYVKKNERQYFWTFNGEFWADELGDYVFSLKSECG